MLALAVAAGLAGCQTAAPLPEPEVGILRLERRFTLPLPSSEAEAGQLVTSLRRFASGRMDSLHLVLPEHAGDGLVDRLVLAGVRPRKIERTPGLAADGLVVAARYVVAPDGCPARNFTGFSLGGNAAPRGLGCTVRSNWAAQAADPADLLGNAATPNPDPDRATIPVARFRAFAPPAALPPMAPPTR